MSKGLIAQRYVKALMASNNANAINEIATNLRVIVPAFNDGKFSEIIESSLVNANQKVDLVISMLNNAPSLVINFIKVLGEKRRLDVIPDILAAIEAQLEIANNNYTGLVYSNTDLATDYINTLSNSLTNKFGKQISLVFIRSDYDGVKVDIESLGLEISFSKDIFRKSLANHILKAV